MLIAVHALLLHPLNPRSQPPTDAHWAQPTNVRSIATLNLLMVLVAPSTTRSRWLRAAGEKPRD